MHVRACAFCSPADGLAPLSSRAPCPAVWTAVDGPALAPAAAPVVLDPLPAAVADYKYDQPIV